MYKKRNKAAAENNRILNLKRYVCVTLTSVYCVTLSLSLSRSILTVSARICYARIISNPSQLDLSIVVLGAVLCMGFTDTVKSNANKYWSEWNGDTCKHKRIERSMSPQSVLS